MLFQLSREAMIRHLTLAAYIYIKLMLTSSPRLFLDF